MARKKAKATPATTITANRENVAAPVIETFDEDDLAREWEEREQALRLATREQAVRRQIEGGEDLGLSDRMMRYRRAAWCPDCRARPVVCMMSRKDYSKFRCRQCGLVWEIKGGKAGEINFAGGR